MACTMQEMGIKRVGKQSKFAKPKWFPSISTCRRPSSSAAMPRSIQSF
jgi:hypothetical protein